MFSALFQKSVSNSKHILFSQCQGKFDENSDFVVGSELCQTGKNVKQRIITNGMSFKPLACSTPVRSMHPEKSKYSSYRVSMEPKYLY